MAAERSRRRTLERSWVIGVVVFVVARFALAYGTLAKYSRLTVVVFGILDLVTAVPYALGTARLVTSLVDRKPQAAARWGILASASFLAPYVWIVLAGTGEGFPAIVYWVVGLLALCLGANAVYSVAKRVHRARQAEEAPPVVVGRDSVPTT